MTDFTPKTIDVKAAYIVAGSVVDDSYRKRFVDGAEKFSPEFERWLNEIRAEAWSEGRRDSTDLVSDAIGFRVVAKNADNPYRAA